MSQRLNRPVIVDNKPGASGNLGTAEAVRAAPDGSTLLVTVNTLVMNRSLYKGLAFDPLRDLEPVTLTSWGQLLLVASKQSGIDSAQALIERAKAKPGAINYGSPGAGTPHHLAMELVKNQTKTFMVHVPYRGTGPARDRPARRHARRDVPADPRRAAAREGRQPEGAGDQLGQAQPAAARRAAAATAEHGQPRRRDVVRRAAPKGTPKETIDRLNGELKRILALPDTKTAFETQGMTPAHGTPEQFRELMTKDAARWAEVIKAQNITAE